MPLAIALPTGDPLCGKRRCPCGQTGIAAPWVAAPTGVVPRVASLVGWHHPPRGHLHGCRPYGCYLRPQTPPSQALAMPAGDRAY
ncbi:hypothetical protein B296_00048638 [Ensete ventricosum]|uniref:Uncharacterized protein n=1 Tax=Ensete ventricosum TaxID=4639 RepID=A0A426XFG4_ENSVE|nr:hypothetical protein B296_00048638 [Ensete ventricosum]